MSRSDKASTYRLIRWAIAVGLTALLLVTQTIWLPSEATVERLGYQVILRPMGAIQDTLLESTWSPTGDALINILIGIVRVLVICLWLVLLLFLLVVAIVAAILVFCVSWLLDNSPIFSLFATGLAIFLIAAAFYGITYMFVPQNRPLPIDQFLIRSLVACLSIALVAGTLWFIADVGMLRSFGLAVSLGIPLVLLERAVSRWARGERNGPDGNWKMLVAACIWLSATALIVYAEMNMR